MNIGCLQFLLRMPPSVPESQLTLPQLFTELQKFVHKNDLKNVVKFSNLILHAKGGQNDVDALKCKSIALIEMEKFGECIKALQEGKFHAIQIVQYCISLHGTDQNLRL